MKTKLAVATLALALMAIPAFAQQPVPKRTLPLSDDFAKAALKAVYAIRDRSCDAVDASRVKGLVEDAEIAASTEGDKLEMHMVSLYGEARNGECEYDRLGKVEDANMGNGHTATFVAATQASIALMKLQEARDREVRAAQGIQMYRFFDPTVEMLKNRKVVFN